jgi:hypothetical protein
LLLLRAVVASTSARISLVAPAVVASVAILLRSSTLAAAILLGPLVLVRLVWIGILLLLLTALVWIRGRLRCRRVSRIGRRRRSRVYGSVQDW